MKYVRETAAIHGIDEKINFRHKVDTAKWSSDRQQWTLHANNDGIEKTYTTRFLICGTGYYDYETPLKAVIPGLESFQGTVVHPQFWPTDLDYSDKRVVVIGSGATAVTLLPALAKTAKHVTQLQRSPSYVLSQPSEDGQASFLRRFLPETVVSRFVRVKYLLLPFIFYHLCLWFPSIGRRLLRAQTARQLPESLPHDPHFNPKYNPWDQRLCLCPDGDFFAALRAGNADVKTGVIRTITENSVELEDETVLEADIIVTATGLKILIAGGAKLYVDDEEVNLNEKFLWKGLMLQDLPNAAFVLGYANASWTLGADATAIHICRILRYMKDNNLAVVVPTMDDKEYTALSPRSPLTLSSTYVKVALDHLPKAADKAPWQPRGNYFTDLWEAKFGNFGHNLRFLRIKQD